MLRWYWFSKLVQLLFNGKIKQCNGNEKETINWNERKTTNRWKKIRVLMFDDETALFHFVSVRFTWWMQNVHKTHEAQLPTNSMHSMWTMAQCKVFIVFRSVILHWLLSVHLVKRRPAMPSTLFSCLFFLVPMKSYKMNHVMDERDAFVLQCLVYDCNFYCSRSWNALDWRGKMAKYILIKRLQKIANFNCDGF